MGQNTCTPPEKPEEKNETATIRYDTKRNQTKRNIVIGQRGLTCPMCPHSIQLIRHVGLTRNANSPRQASQRNNMTEMRGGNVCWCAGVLQAGHARVVWPTHNGRRSEAVASWQSADVARHRPPFYWECHQLWQVADKLFICNCIATCYLPHCHIATQPHN